MYKIATSNLLRLYVWVIFTTNFYVNTSNSLVFQLLAMQTGNLSLLLLLIFPTELLLQDFVPQMTTATHLDHLILAQLGPLPCSLSPLLSLTHTHTHAPHSPSLLKVYCTQKSKEKVGLRGGKISPKGHRKEEKKKKISLFARHKGLYYHKWQWTNRPYWA